MSFTINANSTSSFNGGGGTTISVSVASVAAGSLVVVFACNDSAQTMTCAGGASDVFTAGTLNSNGDKRGQFFYMLSAVNTGTVTYTITFAVSSFERGIVAYVFAPSGAVTFDVQIATGNGSTVTSGNITTTGTDEIVFGGSYDENARTYSAWQINSTNADGNKGTVSFSGWYKTFTSTFTGAATATLSAGGAVVTNAISFKIAAGASGGSNLTHSDLVNGALTSGGRLTA